MLRDKALANGFDALLVVAPPRTLGELRRHYRKEVQARLLGELDKDLTGHDIAGIQRILTAEPATSPTAG
jgi:protein required for attachment to host cells